MGEKATKIPFSSSSLRRCVCIDECAGWIIKVFYIISRSELYEFHSETRHSVSSCCKLEMPTHKAGRMNAWSEVTTKVAILEISALLMPIFYFLTNKTLNSHCIYHEYNSFSSEIIHMCSLYVCTIFVHLNKHTYIRT